MADELVVSARAVFAKGGTAFEFSFGGLAIDVSGTGYIDATQTIGTSAEALGIGDITACGWCFLHNLDSTNYITIRMGASGADLVKLLAGERAQFRLAAGTPYAIADTAACVLRYIIVEA